MHIVGRQGHESRDRCLTANEDAGHQARITSQVTAHDAICQGHRSVRLQVTKGIGQSCSGFVNATVAYRFWHSAISSC